MRPGDIHRTRTLRHYYPKSAVQAIVTIDLDTKKGKHSVVMALGEIDETETESADWLLRAVESIGLMPTPDHPWSARWRELFGGEESGE